MQFKHPEILYVLFALLIPIFIHLFQLQRFVKTPFTNVTFLKHLELQTRKSSKLKKWLVLLSRLLAFAAIIIAFAQPYFSKNNLNTTWVNSIYLDNSLSMKAKGEQGPLLQRAIQDLIKYIPEKGSFNLLTNNNTYTDLNKESFVEIIKNINYSPIKSSIKTVILRLKQLDTNKKGVINSHIIISDFQKTDTSFSLNNQNIDFVKLTAKKNYNISIDSVFIDNITTDNTTLNIISRNQGNKEQSFVLSAYDNAILLAKSSIILPKNSQKTTSLSLPKNHKNILLKIDTEDDCFSFDNSFYVSFNKKEKIKVLLISEQKNSFLEKIYTADEFIFTTKKTNEITFNELHKQNVIILNSFEKVSNSLIKEFVSFANAGGSIIIYPSENTRVQKFDNLLKTFGIGHVNGLIKDSLLITKIHYEHPLLKNVFEKKINNFQYPVVKNHYSIILPKTSPILSYENNKFFIGDLKIGKGKLYLATASLDKSNSNFTNAPLVVPIFYNIAKQSVRQSQISYRLGNKHTIPIQTKINKDEILHIVGKHTDFIPLQEILADKVILHINNKPTKSGFYTVENNKTVVKYLAFNFPKKESKLSYHTIDTLLNDKPNIHIYTSIKESLYSLSERQNIHSYFKWFVLLALAFLLIEILLLKFL